MCSGRRRTRPHPEQGGEEEQRGAKQVRATGGHKRRRLRPHGELVTSLCHGEVICRGGAPAHRVRPGPERPKRGNHPQEVIWASRRAARPSRTFWKKAGSSFSASWRGRGRSTRTSVTMLDLVRGETPRLITTTRSARKTASSIECVTKTMVNPRSS